MQDAENKGVKAPDYDLCKVSVPGTNLFCKDNRGIPRIQMPQLKATPVPGSIAAEKGGGAKVDMAPEFIAEMQAAGIKTTEKTLPASHMRASQMELSGAAVAAFVVDARNKNPKALAALSAPLFVTRDGYVVDGHHRWAALVALDAADGKIDGDVPMNVRELDTDIGRALDMANEFTARVGLRHQAHGEGSVDVTPDTRR